MFAISATDSLACLLDLQSSLEPLPEPFRMQSNAILKLPFAVYTCYISSMKTDSELTLVDGLHVRRVLADADSPKLYQYFLKDIAFAILKELCFAERFHEKATTIIPTSDLEHKVNMQTVETIYNSCESEGIEMVRLFNEFGYVLSPKISNLNLQNYKIAVMLYHMSKFDHLPQEVGIDV